MPEKLTKFDYLLNALLAATATKYPAKNGYGAKRRALFAHVRELEAASIDLERVQTELDAVTVRAQSDAVRLEWLAANAGKEIRITDDGDVTITRWHRRYITYHAWVAKTLRAAIDAARSNS